MKNADLYQHVTDKIIAQLEKGVAPWQQPWASIGGGMPVNVVSRKHYRGINTLLLWDAAGEHGYQSNLWGTYRQWDTLGGHVNRGERSDKNHFLERHQQGDRRSDRPGKRRTKSGSSAENTACSISISAAAMPLIGFEWLDRLAALWISARRKRQSLRRVPTFATAEIGRSSTRKAISFNCRSKSLSIPRPAYYSTALHELIHWTGHESRLNRINKLARFGDQNYAAEELVAELGAAFPDGIAGHPQRAHAWTTPLPIWRIGFRF